MSSREKNAEELRTFPDLNPENSTSQDAPVANETRFTDGPRTLNEACNLDNRQRLKSYRTV